MKTKQQEIDQLKAFVKTIEPGGYLAALLNPEMVMWAYVKMVADMPPNVYEAMTYYTDKSMNLEILANNQAAELANEKQRATN